MERIEHLVARQRGVPPDCKDQTVSKLMRDIGTEVQAEVERHFNFEEQQLFPYLNAAGDEAIGAHLTSEHESMRPLGTRLATLAREAQADGFDQAKWEEFRRLGQELCERMLAHVQKEEMALLPLIDEIMDSETEMKLYEAYVEDI
jgi:hemerythrin-like domain-containing protein